MPSFGTKNPYPYTMIETEDSIYEYDPQCEQMRFPHRHTEDNLIALLLCLKFAQSYFPEPERILKEEGHTFS